MSDIGGPLPGKEEEEKPKVSKQEQSLINSYGPNWRDALGPGADVALEDQGIRPSFLGDAAMLAVTYGAVKNPLKAVEVLGVDPNDFQLDLLAQKASMNPGNLSFGKVKRLKKGVQRIAKTLDTIVSGPKLDLAYETVAVGINDGLITNAAKAVMEGEDLNRNPLFRNVLAFSKKADAVEYYKKHPPFGGEDYAIKNSRSTENPNWTPKRKSNLEAQRLRRAQRLEELNASYAPEVNVRGQDKINAIKAKTMDPHHLVPTHVSKKIKDSMTPEQWAIRVQEDAARYIYHGDHPRNLVAARRSNQAPRHTAGQQSEIFHRQGKPEEGLSGYHTLERKIDSVLHYDQYRNLMAKQMKDKRQATKFLESLGTFIID